MKSNCINSETRSSRTSLTSKALLHLASMACLLLLTLSSALAQGGPGGGGFGYWAISYVYSGQSTIVRTDLTTNGQVFSNTYPWSPDGSLGTYIAQGCPINSRDEAVANGTVTINADWNGFTPPTGSLSLFIVPTAAWGYERLDAALLDHAAVDGMGDPEVITNGGLNGTSSKHHLVLRKIHGTHVSFTLSLFAKISVRTGNINACGWSLNCHVNAIPDTRGVSISSSLDTTYFRTLNQFNLFYPAPNLPDDDGTIHADTLAPLPRDWMPFGVDSLSVTYHATYGGNWGSGSQNVCTYLWKDTLLSPGSSGNPIDGYFNPYLIYDQNALYTNDPAVFGSSDNISVKCYDPIDDVTATGNYFLKFHNKYEDWRKLHNQPLPTDPIDYDHFDGWEIVFEMDNAGSQIVTHQVTFSETKKVTESGTVSSEQSASAPLWDKIAFKINESITIGQEDTFQLTVQDTFTIPARTKMRIFGTVKSDYRQGDCSIWGLHGFTGTGTWNGIKPSGPATSVQIQAHP